MAPGCDNVNAATRPADGPVPLWLVAELTYRCPLHCPFCSNPVDFARASTELTTAEWCRILAEARAMGAVQLGFSGGEPLGRPDLEDLVAEASRLGFYTNLITSGVGLTEPRIRALKQPDSTTYSCRSRTPAGNSTISSPAPAPSNSSSASRR